VQHPRFGSKVEPVIGLIAVPHTLEYPLLVLVVMPAAADPAARIIML